MTKAKYILELLRNVRNHFDNNNIIFWKNQQVVNVNINKRRITVIGASFKNRYVKKEYIFTAPFIKKLYGKMSVYEMADFFETNFRVVETFPVLNMQDVNWEDVDRD